MMPPAPLARIVRQNLRRNLRHFIASAIGLLFGTAAFVFFLALSGGVRKVFLSDIFPIDRVEVIAPKVSLTGGTAILDDGLVARIRGRGEVKRAIPKMRMVFPAKITGNLMGADLALEL